MFRNRQLNFRSFFQVFCFLRIEVKYCLILHQNCLLCALLIVMMMVQIQIDWILHPLAVNDWFSEVSTSHCNILSVWCILFNYIKFLERFISFHLFMLSPVSQHIDMTKQQQSVMTLCYAKGFLNFLTVNFLVSCYYPALPYQKQEFMACRLQGRRVPIASSSWTKGSLVDLLWDGVADSVQVIIQSALELVESGFQDHRWTGLEFYVFLLVWSTNFVISAIENCENILCPYLQEFNHDKWLC